MSATFRETLVPGHGVQAIPHLAELLSTDLKAVVAGSRTLVVNHRLSAERWKAATIGADHHVIDLVNVPELRGTARYDGLYW